MTSTQTGCHIALDPDMVPSRISGPDIFMSPGGSKVHSDLCGPGGNMTLKLQHGPDVSPYHGNWFSLWW